MPGPPMPVGAESRPQPVTGDADSSAIALTRSTFVETFHSVLANERVVLDQVAARLALDTVAVEKACLTLAGRMDAENGGRVIISGLGKSGLVARKIAATFTSLGTAATFLHPVEALHGDLGFVQTSDRALLLSLSGETVELVRLAAELNRLGCPFVAMTRSADTSLGRQAAVCLELGDVAESCYLGVAPTASTTAMLAVGDALAQAVARAKNFRMEDFAKNHPAGSLGLRFRSVSELMRTGKRLVCVSPEARLTEVVKQVTAAKTGAAVVVDERGGLLGIFTDGDLRRACLGGGDVLEQTVNRWATMPCLSLESIAVVSDALKIFQNRRIEDLPVVDSTSGAVLGLLCLKDIPNF